MKYREGDLALLGRFDEANIAERLQGRRQQAGANVDHRHLGFGIAERVEDFHLVRNFGDVDDFGHRGMKTLERAARRFGVEGARRRTMRAEIIEQRAGDGGFSNTALIGADEDDCGSGHRGYSEKLIKKGAASRIQTYVTPYPAVNNDRIVPLTHAILGHSPAWVKNL